MNPKKNNLIKEMFFLVVLCFVICFFIKGIGSVSPSGANITVLRGNRCLGMEGVIG